VETLGRMKKEVERDPLMSTIKYEDFTHPIIHFIEFNFIPS
jgi:hypothetical protein